MSVEEGVVAALELQVRVVAAAHAQKHARGRALEAIGRLACAFERLPAHFEHQALLRIHTLRLARRDAEEAGIESVDGTDKAARPRRDAAGHLRIGGER